MAYRPDIHDFFPKLRRGHGTTHPSARMKDGDQVREGNVCVNDACSLKRRQTRSDEKVKGEMHIDPAANAGDWKEEHGFDKDTPLEYCHR